MTVQVPVVNKLVNRVLNVMAYFMFAVEQTMVHIPLTSAQHVEQWPALTVS